MLTEETQYESDSDRFWQNRFFENLKKHSSEVHWESNPDDKKKTENTVDFLGFQNQSIVRALEYKRRNGLVFYNPKLAVNFRGGDGRYKLIPNICVDIGKLDRLFKYQKENGAKAVFVTEWDNEILYYTTNTEDLSNGIIHVNPLGGRTVQIRDGMDAEAVYEIDLSAWKTLNLPNNHVKWLTSQR